MTIRTGKGGRYRYYTCSIKARQGETGCIGRSIPMSMLDDLVVEHLETRLLDPTRLEQVLAVILDHRRERAGQRRAHVSELRRTASEAEARLRRLYGAIESGVAALGDQSLKDRIAELRTIRDQAQANAERAEMVGDGGGPAITPDRLDAFAQTARQSLRGGGWPLSTRPPTSAGSAD